MATKQIKTLEQVQAEKDLLLKQLEALNQDETNIIEESKTEAFNALFDVVNKYRLKGADVVNALLVNRKMSFKDIQKVEPVYLINTKVQKKARKTGLMVESDFFYYEGKVILADAEQARAVCANGLDAFKAILTEKGKTYLADDKTKSILVKFYNDYKPPQAQKME